MHRLLLLVALTSCQASPPTPATAAPAVRIAHLGHRGGDATGFAALRADFNASNAGYDVAWHTGLRDLRADDAPLVVLVQSGRASGRVERAAQPAEIPEPDLDVGDAVLLRPGERLTTDRPIDAVVFSVTETLPSSLPTFVRPDWDPEITDTPGGCAEETGAYRRILLTWLESVGPYVYHALNCHRVRITDSFAHYHPEDGGFDELYLVQMAQPGALLFTSAATARIEDPTSVTRSEATTLIQTHPLEVGDLVYLPRGTVHRGFGGVLAQIITVPGFRPGAEIGVDHQLRAINAALGLEGADALPYRAASADRAVVK